jgi:hypothetical protein
MRHGDVTLPPEEAEEIAHSADPELALVNADMALWHELHPCDCEALCVCDL